MAYYLNWGLTDITVALALCFGTGIGFGFIFGLVRYLLFSASERGYY